MGLSSIRQKEITGAPILSEPKLGKCLRMLATKKCGHGQHLRGGYYALTTSTVKAYFEHSYDWNGN